MHRYGKRWTAAAALVNLNVGNRAINGSRAESKIMTHNFGPNNIRSVFSLIRALYTIILNRISLINGH